ncbi:MAG: S8 family serine peptidase [Anaerolineales bacterium]|nr:S8 family serine peptidase [Anaerolineales bacterium]
MIRRIFTLSIPFLLTLIAFIFLLQTHQTASATDWQSKVSPAVLSQLNGRDGQAIDFLVQMSAQANLSGAAALPSKEAKGQFVYEQLTAVAAQSQRPLLDLLDAQHIPHESYWINNTIWVRGTAAAVETIAQRPDVAYLYANPAVPFDEPDTIAQQQADALDALAVEWGVDRIDAPLVWANGITGTGVVIAGQDTGYQWDHPALIEQYRGWNTISDTADHNYNWHDAIHEDISGNSSNPCGFDLLIPCDDHSHGTHTMGTMVGDDGNGNQVGVAPGAKWISCRNMEQGYGTPQTYIECFQWFLAPTDLNGENPRPDLAPHVINNSWGCPPSEGCNPDNFAVMEMVVDNLRTAGVAVVTSAGNSGSSCGSVDDPAGIFDSSITVGNTTSAETISFSSSRGPVMVDGSMRLKPDLSAPGTSVRSTVPGNGYGLKTGTSMAAPHVAGAIGLLIATHPELAGDVDTLEALLLQTAVPKTTGENCGGIPGTTIPNNTYGHGRLDVYTAYQTHIVRVDHSAPSVTSTLVGKTFSYQFGFTHFHPLSASGQISLTAVLPNGIHVVSATHDYTQDEQMVTWLWDGVLPQESVTLSVTLQATAAVSPIAIPLSVSTSDANSLVTDIRPWELTVTGDYFYNHLPVIILANGD